jgi:hypothetical protein
MAATTLSPPQNPHPTHPPPPQVCLEYLERYYVLIAFAAYVGSSRFNPGGPQHVTYEDWVSVGVHLCWQQGVGVGGLGYGLR